VGISQHPVGAYPVKIQALIAGIDDAKKFVYGKIRNACYLRKCIAQIF
jgi:hypothetical protein